MGMRLRCKGKHLQVPEVLAAEPSTHRSTLNVESAFASHHGAIPSLPGQS